MAIIDWLPVLLRVKANPPKSASKKSAFFRRTSAIELALNLLIINQAKVKQPQSTCIKERRSSHIFFKLRHVLLIDFDD